MGKPSRDKGAAYERKVAVLMGATKVSGYYLPGPDLTFRGRYVECRKRGKGTGYQSMNQIVHELDGDASLYVTALDYGDDFVVLRLTDLLDLIDE